MTQLMMQRRTGSNGQASRKWLTDAHRMGQKDTYAGKRRQTRYTWNTAVTVEFVDDADETPLFATTRDISIGGLGIRTRRRIDVNTLVRISTDATNESVRGRVRHCSESLGGFFVGIEFVESTPSPKRSVVPSPMRRVA